MDPGYYKLHGPETLEHGDIYRQAIGSLLYLVVNNRLDILMWLCRFLLVVKSPLSFANRLE